jgi:adenine-specific DNA-methyltransferase
MPKKPERVLLPYHKYNAALLSQIDKLICSKTYIEKVLKITNQIMLKEHFGFTQKEIGLPNSIEKKLSNRPLKRRK